MSQCVGVLTVLWDRVGVGVKLRLLADLIETTFDFSSVAYAMKEDAWKTYVATLSAVHVFRTTTVKCCTYKNSITLEWNGFACDSSSTLPFPPAPPICDVYIVLPPTNSLSIFLLFYIQPSRLRKPSAY